MASKSPDRVRMRNVGEYGAGSVRQRTVDDAVKSIGGKGTKAYQAAKDYGPVARSSAEDIVKGRTVSNSGGAVRTRSSRASRLMTTVENAAGSKTRTLLKASLRGMLSPAGAAEEVVARVAKHMGADEEPMYEKMRASKRLTKPARRTY